MDINQILREFSFVVLYSTLPGCAAGIALSLFSLKKGYYKNNRYKRKFTIEILGAMITASFLSSLISDYSYRAIAAFSIGLGWSGIIQIVRIKITKIVEVALGENMNKGNDNVA